MPGKAFEYLLTRPLMVTPAALEAAVRLIDRDPAVRAVEGRKGAAVDNAEAGMTRHGSTAVIPVVGPIFRYADWFTDLCGGATVESIARDLTAAVEDPSVRSVVLNFDSPGGEAAGIGELAQMIRGAAGRKRVVAYADGMACSAAYWLASAASEVVCSESAMLGSIGVVMGYTKTADRPGVKTYEFVSSQSPNKRPDPDTETGRSEIQRTVDDLADVFIKAVASYRGVSAKTVASDFGRGGVLVGRKAVAAKMADRVGMFDGLIRELAGGASPRPAGGNNGKAAAAAGSQAAVSQTASEIARLRAETAVARADNLFHSLSRDGVVAEAERSAFGLLAAQAAVDDLVAPLAGGPSRLRLLEDAYRARGSAASTAGRPGAGPEAPPTQARLNELMQHLVDAGMAPASAVKH